MKTAPRRIAKIRGCAVEMLSRNMKLVTVIYHARFSEVYETERQAKQAAYVWEKKGVALLAEDISKHQKEKRLPLFERAMQQSEATA